MAGKVPTRPRHVYAGRVRKTTTPRPRTSNWRAYRKYQRLMGNNNPRVVDYIRYMEELFGHKERTKWWRFKRTALSRLFVEVWEEEGNVRFGNFRFFQVFFWIAKNMELTNDVQFWTGELAQELGMGKGVLQNILRTMQNRGVITRTTSRGGFVRVWLCMNYKYYGYMAEAKQCRAMWERVERREAKAKARGPAKRKLHQIPEQEG